MKVIEQGSTTTFKQTIEVAGTKYTLHFREGEFIEVHSRIPFITDRDTMPVIGLKIFEAILIHARKIEKQLKPTIKKEKDGKEKA